MGDELEAHIMDEELQAYFAHLNLDIGRAWDIFRLIDIDKSGAVSMEEFVEGCLKLRGDAKTLDVANIMYMLDRLQGKLSSFMSFVEDNFHSVKGEIQRSASYVARAQTGADLDM